MMSSMHGSKQTRIDMAKSKLVSWSDLIECWYCGVEFPIAFFETRPPNLNQLVNHLENCELAPRKV